MEAGEKSYETWVARLQGFVWSLRERGWGVQVVLASSEACSPLWHGWSGSSNKGWVLQESSRGCREMRPSPEPRPGYRAGRKSIKMNSHLVNLPGLEGKWEAALDLAGKWPRISSLERGAGQ